MLSPEEKIVHTNKTKVCVDALTSLDDKYKVFMAKHKEDSEAAIKQFNEQINVMKSIDKQNSIFVDSELAVLHVNLKKTKALGARGAIEEMAKKRYYSNNKTNNNRNNNNNNNRNDNRNNNSNNNNNNKHAKKQRRN
jgi:hypothetical protein